MAAEPGLQGHPRNGRIDQLIEKGGSGLGNGVAWLVDHGILFGLFALMWIAFAIGLIWGQGSLDEAWSAIGALPLIVQVIVWVLFLPVMLGMWVWETDWPLVVRVVLVMGFAAWNLLMFLPKRVQETQG